MGMLPLEPRKNMITKRGTHFFDLFYDSSERACISLIVNFLATSEKFEGQLIVNCGNVTELQIFNYTENNFYSKRCFEKNFGIPFVAETCNYFYKEVLRITIFTNATILIEDLSKEVQPGARMFFRTDTSKSIVTDRNCPCKNLHNGQNRYIDCLVMYQALINGNENTLVSFDVSLEAWITVGVFFVAGSTVIFGWFWISKQIKQQNQVVDSTCTI